MTQSINRTILAGLVLSLAVAMLMAFSGMALAAEKAEPAFDQYPQQVDLKYVKAMVDGKTKGVLIDARPKAKKFDKGHIPGSINLPATQFDKMAAKVLPKDKNTLLVYYCGGFKCALSHKAAFKSEKLGYKNIKVFPAGYPAWKKAYGPGPTSDYDRVAAALKEKGVTPFPVIVDAKFVKDIADHKVPGLVVDSRPARKKYDTGHIPGSISLPWSQFDKLKGLLPADKNMMVVFYCGGLKCPLSHKSAFAAKKLGYKNVKVFAEGYPTWVKAYGAGAAGAAAAPKAEAKADKKLKAGKEEGSVDIVLFQEIMTGKGPAVMLVDVREPKEFKSGAIKGSVNIPVDKLEKSLDQLPKDKPVIFVCGTGARSGEAYYMMRDLKPEMTEVYYVDGEITFKDDGTATVAKPKK